MKYRRDDRFFQLAFFRCQARRRPEWNDIEVEAVAGDLCCIFHFDSATSLEALKIGMAQKLLVELDHAAKQLRSINADN